MNFSERLKYYRQQRGYTQTDIANKLQMTNQNYNRYETKNVYPRLDIAIKIADILGITINDLIGNNTNNSNEAADIFHLINKWNILLRPEYEIKQINDTFIIHSYDFDTPLSYDEFFNMNKQYNNAIIDPIERKKRDIAINIVEKITKNYSTQIFWKYVLDKVPDEHKDTVNNIFTKYKNAQITERDTENLENILATYVFKPEER